MGSMDVVQIGMVMHGLDSVCFSGRGQRIRRHDGPFCSQVLVSHDEPKRPHASAAAQVAK